MTNNNTINNSYEMLLKDVLENGVYKEDRTKTGTYSLFGKQVEYDLSDSFPLITTKKVNFNSVVGELLWFLRGETNIDYLKENNINIWNEWADEYGFLGTIYGSQWRKWYSPSDEDIDVPIYKGDIITLTGNSDTPISNEDYNAPEKVKKLWNELLENKKMCLQWYDFERFYKEIRNCKGFEQWYRDSEYFVLCPQYFATDFICKDTSIFLPYWYKKELLEQILVKENEEYLFDNNTSLANTGEEIVTRKKFFFDQIEEIVNTVKNNPDSRRIILNAWNVAEIDNMALPPCHTMFQLYVSEGKLSGQLYQRSADLFLGVPFNIASYSLLIHMIARLTGLEVGKFVWTGGDCHIYSNHVEQVKEQLSRELKDFPTIEFSNDSSTPIDEYEINDIKIINYEPHPFIKGEVAV